MSFLSILFNANRKPEVAKSIESPDDVVQRSLAFSGGTLLIRNGAQIDAALDSVSVVATDGKPVVLSALGKMRNCHIEGNDVLIMGEFSGEILAMGDVEVCDSASFKGTIAAAGRVLLSPVASDFGEVTVKKLTAKPAPVVAQTNEVTDVLTEFALGGRPTEEASSTVVAET